MAEAVPVPVVRRMSLADEAATVALARRIAGAAHPGDVIALSGELGVGKTRFARAVIDALTGDSEDVPSPTFTLAQTYESPVATIWHFDLYRLSRAEDVYELGIEDAFAGGICLIEWPDRLQGLLPAERLEVALAYGAAAGARAVRLTGHGGWAGRVKELWPDG